MIRSHDTHEHAQHLQHETMKDEETKAELRDATIEARQAHTDVLALIRLLDSSGTHILFAALEHVLADGGVPVAYMKPFRAWSAS